MKHLILAIGIATCLLPQATYAQTIKGDNVNPSFNVKKMDSLLQAIEQHEKIMGTLTLSRNGKTLYERSLGYRQYDDQKQVKADVNTHYRIGSISKMFTATMLFQLAEEHKLSLEDHLSKYYPQIPNASQITLEQMMNHHSGIHNFTDSMYMTYYTKPKTHEELLSIFAAQQPDFDPGTQADYSNTNYVLLGYIIEKVTGKTLAQNLQERICKKIGLKHTYIGGPINPSKNEAFSFSKNENGKWEKEPITDMSIPGGAGSVVSTTGDLTTFINALFSHKLIGQESLEKMTAIKDNYGMGIFQLPFGRKKAYGHTGAIDAFNSNLAYFPEDSLAVAFLSNGQDYGMNEVMIGVLSIYFNKPYNIPDFSSIHIPAEALGKYEGLYSSKDFPLKITVKKDGNVLTAQATGQGAFPLTPISETEFRFDRAGIVMIFTLEKDGTVPGLELKQGGGAYHFTKE